MTDLDQTLVVNFDRTRPAALRTAACELFGVEYPIIQTGMGWVSGAQLTAATSAAGGLGILASATMTLEELGQAIKKVKVARAVGTQGRFLLRYCCRRLWTGLADLKLLYWAPADSLMAADLLQLCPTVRMVWLWVPASC